MKELPTQPAVPRFRAFLPPQGGRFENVPAGEITRELLLMPSKAPSLSEDTVTIPLPAHGKLPPPPVFTIGPLPPPPFAAPSNTRLPTITPLPARVEMGPVVLPPAPRLPRMNPSEASYTRPRQEAPRQEAPRARDTEPPQRQPMPSAPPTVSTLPPARHKTVPKGAAALAGVLAGICLFLSVLLIVKAHLSSARRAMVVSVAGPGGTSVPGARVYVDGVLRCSSAPCRVVVTDTGTHLVSVDADGFSATAPRAIRVDEDSAVLHMELARENASVTAPLAAPPAAALPPAPVTPQPAAAPARPPAQPEPAAKSSAKANLPSSLRPSGGARLNINSIPIASVVLDGRPLGKTPKLNVRVSPGVHSVVFISKKGRKVQFARVAAGQTATVATRF